MDLGGAEGVAVARGELVGDDLVEDALDVLEVGHVAGRADDGGVADGMQAGDVLKAGEGAVRRYSVQICALVRMKVV